MGHVALYALTLRWYLAAVWHKHVKKKSERWICIVLLLGLIEACLGCLYLGLVNVRGTPMLTLNLFGNIATAAKITLAFCLGMCLAQADGMPHPAEGPGPIQDRIQKGRLPFRICVAVYLVAKLIQWWGIYEMRKPGDTTTLDDYWYNKNGLRRHQAFMWMVFYARFASVYISALVTVVLVVWMVFAVSKTIKFMKSILVDTDPRTVRRYERLRHVLLFTSVMGVATVSSITFVLPFLAPSFNKIDENPWGVYLGRFP